MSKLARDQGWTLFCSVSPPPPLGLHLNKNVKQIDKQAPRVFCSLRPASLSLLFHPPKKKKNTSAGAFKVKGSLLK